MRANSHQTNFKFSKRISRNLLVISTGISMCIAFSAFSGNACAADSDNDASAQQSRSQAFQKKVQAEKDAEDKLEHDFALQEQARKEQDELSRIRAERAKARNERAAAAKLQEQQQQQQQK